MAAKIKIRKLSFTLIFIVLVLMISFIAFCNYGFSFSPEKLAVLNKAQKSLDSHKLQENASQTFSTKKTDSHFSIGYKEYENTTYGVDVMYPKGWKWTYQDPDYYESNPETIFIILFVSPTKGDVNFAGITIKIENLESAMMTSEQYRDQTVTYLKGSYPDIKEVSVSKTTLAGKPAYQIESMQRFL